MRFEKLIIVLISIAFFSSCNQEEISLDENDPFEISRNSILFQGSDEDQFLEINAVSGTAWKTDPIYRDWLTVAPTEGTGNGKIKISVKANHFNQSRIVSLNIRTETGCYPVSIEQKPGENTPPSVVSLLSPLKNTSNIVRYPMFNWLPAVDLNKDTVYYQVSISEDRKEWTSTERTLKTSFYMAEVLKSDTEYFWKVIATDQRGASSESEIYSFRTDNRTVRADGEFWRYEDDVMNGPIPLIFTGDGYVAADFVEGGLFDQKADEGISHFFSIEPLKSLRHHFTVYKVAAHSRESGISRYQLDDNVLLEKVNTVFNTRYYGNGYNSTLMKTNTDKVYQYARKVAGITDKELSGTTVVLLANSPTYSGTCWWDYSGRTVSIVPTCDDYQPYSYQMTMIHEASGHGFGQLADEYLFENRAVTAQEKNNLVYWGKAGYNQNIDITGNPEQIKWSYFLSDGSYPLVGTYEGAQYISGVWMPESSSCMRYMSHLYFNAPSREAIFKRIMNNLDQPVDFNIFKRFDQKNKMCPLRFQSDRLHENRGIKHTPPQFSESN